MGDRDERSLERRWRADGDVDAGAAYLADQVQRGALSSHALRVAALAGEPAAEQAVGDVGHARARCMELSRWGGQVSLRTANAVAAACLDYLDAHPDDPVTAEAEGRFILVSDLRMALAVFESFAREPEGKGQRDAVLAQLRLVVAMNLACSEYYQMRVAIDGMEVMFGRTARDALLTATGKALEAAGQLAYGGTDDWKRTLEKVVGRDLALGNAGLDLDGVLPRLRKLVATWALSEGASVSPPAASRARPPLESRPLPPSQETRPPAAQARGGGVRVATDTTVERVAWSDLPRAEQEELLGIYLGRSDAGLMVREELGCLAKAAMLAGWGLLLYGLFGLYAFGPSGAHVGSLVAGLVLGGVWFHGYRSRARVTVTGRHLVEHRADQIVRYTLSGITLARAHEGGVEVRFSSKDRANLAISPQHPVAQLLLRLSRG